MARWHLTFWATEVWLTRHWDAAALTQAFAERASFGPGRPGLDAAAVAHFGMPAREVSVAQAVFLIARLEGRPASAPGTCVTDWARPRQLALLGRFMRAGVLSPDEKARAQAAPLGLLPLMAADCPHH